MGTTTTCTQNLKLVFGEEDIVVLQAFSMRRHSTLVNRSSRIAQAKPLRLCDVSLSINNAFTTKKLHELRSRDSLRKQSCSKQSQAASLGHQKCANKT